ncbi:G protein coupled receptor bride of sevenless [Rhodnius prolixus]|uniref:G protein coupled receptor bride of sevenless n=1 Tax=Rhodnius prolixus TaxID=13249 RepID=UPI003D18EA27
MFGIAYCILVYSLTLNFLISGQNICDNKDFVYQIPGDLLIIGLFGLHDGENCSTPDTVGMEVMKSVVNTVNLARNENFIPNLQIGLNIYDTCSQQEILQKSIVAALVEAECMQAFVLGAITDTPFESEAINLSETLHLPVTLLNGAKQNPTLHHTVLVKETVRLMLNNGFDEWMSSIDYLITSDSEKETTKYFLELAMQAGVCIKKTLNLTQSLSMVESKSNLLIMAKYKEMQDVLKTLPPAVNLLLVPLDGVYDTFTEVKADRLLIVLPTNLEFPSTNNNYSTVENQNDSIITAAITVPQISFRQVQIFSDLLHFLEHIKNYLQKHCNQMILCQDLPKIGTNFSLPQINTASWNRLRKMLKVQVESTICALMEQSADGSLKILAQSQTENQSVEGDAHAAHIVRDSILNYNNCINIVERDTIEVVEILPGHASIWLKNDSWVAALLSVCAVGISCCLAIAAFIVVRLCKGDMLEGNPGFSFLMLFSMIIMYSAVLPYSVEVIDDHHYYTGVVCGIKAVGTSLSYSLVYSVMLARSVMLASCDEDGGFMSHVNGYLQTVLCFFIAAVQIALTLQFWAVNWLILTKEQCSSMTEGPLFLYLLGYDMFLLILLLCISPFIMKSKRNYHEGGYFAVATFLCLLVWIGWTIGYILLPAWADLFVCIGLMATASIVLISVFIPRTYLMLTGIVRDHIVSTLPHSLSHTAATSVLDVNYRSTQALYDSVNTGGLIQPAGLLQQGGQVNPNYYAERPTTPSTSKIEDRVASEASNLYERYDRSPSPPLNVTRF